MIRIYLASIITIICINLILCVLLINQSAQGSITEVNARRFVAPLLTLKVIFIIPETVLNIFGSIWAFCGSINCKTDDFYSKTVIEITVVLNWIVFGLIIFGFLLVYNPLGSSKYRKTHPTETFLHKKVSKVWINRFRWVFCCLRRDEYGQEAFMQVASLLSALFRSTDLVPSDIIAGSILLRVRQKRETREMRRIRMLNADGPRYTTDMMRLFATSPPWMTVANARYMLRFALSSYGWPMVCYLKCCSGCFKLLRNATCCGCCRSQNNVVDDNCCLCHFGGVREISRLRADDIVYVSFKNHVFELPFCLLLDHVKKQIVLTVRGSLSFRDVFTDLTADATDFQAPNFPVNSAAHRGMVIGAEKIIQKLEVGNLLNRVCDTYADYTLTLTGHSLGGGVSILIGAKLREKYPDLRVYAFATPAGLLSREAARITESFVFTVGVGDDFVMRLCVESVENIRTNVIETLRACKLPKYRILLNGFGYTMFTIPSRDLETTWRDVSDLSVQQSVHSPSDQVNAEAALVSKEISLRRFAKTRLYTGGRILHIIRRKKTEMEKKTKTGGPTYEMKWCQPEEFQEFRVMPRMVLDHLPDNVFKCLTTILEEQKVQDSKVSLQSL
ncbi:hypothetical protein ACKWTF_012212 [Chironomus riparius]